ncbi:MAG: hypothetical protein ACTSRP_05325 [Candidatus Helarchaeota archaeon]
MKDFRKNKFKDFINKYLKYFFEDFKYIRLRIVGIKENDDYKKVWEIIQIRGDYSSIKKEEIKFFKSIHNKIILFELYMNIDNFYEFLTSQEFIYQIENEDNIFKFSYKLKIPNDFEEFKKKIYHSGISNILKSEKPVYLFYMNNLYSEQEYNSKKNGDYHNILREVIFRINNKKIICDANNIFERFLKTHTQYLPTLFLCFPLESIDFEYKLNKDNEKNIIEYEWKFKEERYKQYLYPFYDYGNEHDISIDLKGIIELEKGSFNYITMKLMWYHPEFKLGHNYFFIRDILIDRESKQPQAQQFQILSEIEKNFRKCINKEPNSEKDIQDFLESFLHAKGYDFEREKENVNFSEKGFKPDFTFNKLEMVLEIKFIDSKKKKKKIIDEMSADLEPYSKKWKYIFFIVYDKGGYINDIERFTSDFNNNGEKIIRCVVIKH